jgi:Virulence factor BrkB
VRVRGGNRPLLPFRQEFLLSAEAARIIETGAKENVRPGVARPWRLRVRKWVNVLKHALISADRNHMSAFAAGLSYYFVLSSFPALIAMSAVVSFVSLPDLFSPMLAVMSRVVPTDSMGTVNRSELKMASGQLLKTAPERESRSSINSSGHKQPLHNFPGSA